MQQTVSDLRPNLVGLAEVVPDGQFPSTIGNKHGDIYELQFETAKNSHMNDPKLLPELWRTTLKPVYTMLPVPKL